MLAIGMASWQSKNITDAMSKHWSKQDWKGKLAVGFTNSPSKNSHEHSTLLNSKTLAMQRVMLWVGTVLVPSNPMAASRDDINYPGSHTGLMAQSPSDAGTDEVPTAGAIETAKVSDVRVATVVCELSR